MTIKPVQGLYEKLITEELERLLAELEPAQVARGSLDAADAHVAVAEYLRRIIERALCSFPEDDRLTTAGAP